MSLVVLPKLELGRGFIYKVLCKGYMKTTTVFVEI